jgi:hypothetical protein
VTSNVNPAQLISAAAYLFVGAPVPHPYQSEYVRGIVELLVDVLGMDELPMDDRKEAVWQMIVDRHALVSAL